MTLDEFIEEMKNLVQYKDNKHYMGSTVLTNQELNLMLETLLGDEYTKLNYSQRRRIRQQVFKECSNG